MRNYTTIIDVEKTSAETGKLLGGARLQLIDKSDGRVIREWTSEAGRGAAVLRSETRHIYHPRTSGPIRL